MTSPRLQDIETIFHSALERGPDQLDSFLDAVCNGNAELQNRVKMLLESYWDFPEFIETPPDALAARIIEGEEERAPIGRTLGHYKIIEHLGRGGMGEVYLALDIRAERKAVLKLLPARFTTHPERLRRFKQEARAVVALNHPNIVTIYEIGDEDSTYYIASELIEGETLRQRLARGSMALEQVIEVAIQLGSALAAAHQAGVVHRDIKPENIMLRHDGYVKVLDFGIAKLAQPEVTPVSHNRAVSWSSQTLFGSAMGTLRYMSPEQIRGEPVDERTDIWSFGVVLYEMLTGRPPFSGKTMEEILLAIERAQPLILPRQAGPLTATLQQIISHALAIEHGRRFAQIDELLKDLKLVRRALDRRPNSASGRPQLLSNRGWAAAVAATLAVLLLGAAFLLRQRSPENLPAKPIAVLPFSSAREVDDYLIAGIQDELAARLGRIPGLRVIAPGPTRRAFADDKDLSDIGRMLRVRYVLKGHVERNGEELRLSVELKDTARAQPVWSQTYTRRFADLFRLETEVATQIAVTLNLGLSESTHGALALVPTQDTQAHDLYLQGHYLAGRNHGEDLKPAIGFYEQAIARDRSYASAYAGLAEAYVLLAAAPKEMPANHYYALAGTAAEKALSYDPMLAETHLALGLAVRYQDRDFARAQQELERATELAAYGARPHYYLGSAVLVPQGDFTRAIPEMQRAVELDPFSADIHAGLGTCYFLGHRYTEAVTELQNARSLDRNSVAISNALGMALLFAGRTNEAMEAWQRTFYIGGGAHSLAALSYGHAVKGNRSEAERFRAQLDQEEQNMAAISPLEKAALYLAFGEKEQALEWLERGAAENDQTLVNSLKVTPLLDSLRGDPRFGHLVSEVVPSQRAREGGNVRVAGVNQAPLQPQGEITYGLNLLVNGNAEQGPASAAGMRVKVPGWTTNGEFTVVPYGAPEGYPSANQAAPQGGRKFFAGGRSAVSSASQEIDLSRAANDIDAGALICEVSGWLGGYCDQTDDARFAVHFQNGAARDLETLTVGPVTALERANQTTFKFRSRTMAVPPGTRRLQAVLWLTRKSNAGLVNDGYADNVSVLLRAPAARPAGN